MALTVIQGDTFASSAGVAKGSERVENDVPAGSTFGAQNRKNFADRQGDLGGFGRASNGITTYLRLKDNAGADVFISYPSGSAVISGTAP